MAISPQLLQYAGVFILIVFAAVLISAMLVLSTVLGKRGRRLPIKDTPYECGMLPVGTGTPPMTVRFYLVAMLFILFDIEVVFLYPWAVIYREFLQSQADMIFGSMLAFLGVLMVGYVYALKRGAFHLSR